MTVSWAAFLWKDVLTITAVQSTTKPESIFLNRTDERIPKLGNLIILGHRELIYTFLGKGYVDAVAAHEESIVQYRKDYDASFRILEEPLRWRKTDPAARRSDRNLCSCSLSVLFLPRRKSRSREKNGGDCKLCESAVFHYTHYNESSESKSLLRAIESARQMSTNIKMETENGGQLREDFLKEKRCRRDKNMGWSGSC